MEIDQQAASTNGTDCPVWCVLRHDDTDDLDELVHESAHLAIAGVIPVRNQHSEDGRARQAAPAEIGVVRYQYAGDDEDWIYLGDGHRGLELSPESARRLAQVVRRLLEDATATNVERQPRLDVLHTDE